MERYDDGQWAINYLPHLYEAEHGPGINNIDVLTAHRDQIIKLLSDVKSKGSPDALSKVRWVASYHNRVIKYNFRRLFEKYEDMGNTLLVSLD